MTDDTDPTVALVDILNDPANDGDPADPKKWESDDSVTYADPDGELADALALAVATLPPNHAATPGQSPNGSGAGDGR